jgi:CRISPR system Cascade subunit CasE
MYLSKLTLDPRHPKARRDLADPYEMHRTLARAYAPEAETPPQHFLWRLERRADYGPSSVVLVQSAQPANWSVVEGLPGYVAEIHRDKPVDLEKLIRPSGRYRFRLLANPTVTREGKRWGLIHEEEQLAWLARQGERGGFNVLGCVRAAEERLQVRQGKTGNRITVHTALFEGMLEAVNDQGLRASLLNGLGHAKALGLGLLSLAKVTR